MSTIVSRMLIMIKIRIIGDIGSGKSFVSRQFFCQVFNADKEVEQIYFNDKELSIDWNINTHNVILSEKDIKGLPFNKIKSPF